MDKFKTENLVKTAQYAGLGTQLAATVVIMFFVGKYLDDVLDTYPLLVILMSLLGSFAGIYNFIRTVLNLNKKKNQNSGQ